MLTITCDLCSGRKCQQCGWKGWYYLFRSLEGDVLRGIEAWKRRRIEREEHAH